MSELQIKFFAIDPAAKADILSIAVSDQKPWSDTNDLKYDKLPPPAKFATHEWNYTVLDGTYEELDITRDETWGLWSDSQSDENGIFEDPPMLDIRFGANHKSRGLTFYFYPHTPDFAREIRATWFNSADEVIASGIYELTSTTGVIREAVADFRRIKLEILSTSIPHRYVKLFALDYGVIRIIPDEEITSCSILEEVDPTGESLSVNTFNASIRTREPFFSPTSGAAADSMMMERQIMTITKNGIPFGTFFLDTWKDVNRSGMLFDFAAQDATGVLDLYQFMGGIYVDSPADELLTEIFKISFPTGLIKYILDPALSGAKVTGWIPICSCGEALQHICFALNATADTARVGDVWIYPKETELTFDIPFTDQYLSGDENPTDYYSGVDVVSYSFTPGTEVVEVQNGSLVAGRHRIEFSEPLHTLSITGAAIIERDANYAIVNVASAGNVVLSGRKYIINRLTHSARAEVAAGEVQSIKRFENYSLVNPSIGQGLADAQFAYLQYRLKVENDIRLNEREVGYVGKIESNGLPVVGVITSLDSNLRANKARVVLVGNV